MLELAVALPTYDQIVHPLLMLLAERPQGMRSREVYSHLASRIGLTESDLSETRPTNDGRQRPVFEDRVRWAHDRLKRSGLSSTPTRGIWRTTEAGNVTAARYSDSLPDNLLMSILQSRNDSVSSSQSTGTVNATESTTPRLTAVRPEGSTIQSASPVEAMEAAARAVRESVGAELLELVFAGSPAFFERLVIDLLVAMGYGTRNFMPTATPASSDGGVDGVVTLDRLGLEKVYDQAKRWRDEPVGRPHIQAFVGALAGRRAHRGVFITSSRFTHEAQTYAKQTSDTLVLIDGHALAQFMMEYKIGVNVEQTFEIVAIDSDYFSEE